MAKGSKNEPQGAVCLPPPALILKAQQPQELLAMRGECGRGAHLATSWPMTQDSSYGNGQT